MAFVFIFLAYAKHGIETVSDFNLLGSKITVDSDCNHKIKRRLLLGRKSYDNLGSILKSRDITLPANIHLVKALVFPVVMYKFETWTIMIPIKPDFIKSSR